MSLYNEDCKINYEINSQKKNLVKFTQNILQKSSQDQIYPNKVNCKDSLQERHIDLNMGQETCNQDIKFKNFEELESKLLEKENKIKLQNKEIETLRHKIDELVFQEEKKESRTNENELELKISRLALDYDSLYKKFTKSETIREEQSKLINSLQREIEMLRNLYTWENNNIDGDSNNNKNKKEEIKNKILPSENLVKNLKPKKKSKKIVTKKIPKSSSKIKI